MTDRVDQVASLGPAPQGDCSPGAGRSPQSPSTPQQSSPRREYHRPHLESLGRLSRLTRFGGSEITDSGGGLGLSP